MGNISLKKSKKKSINNECPICFVKNNHNFITLECGHSFNYYCIQRHCLTKFYNNSKILCPLCNNEIDKLILKKINNNSYCLSNDPIEWYRKDILELAKVRKISINFFNFNKIIILNFTRTINYFYNTNLYLYSPVLTSITLSDNEIFSTPYYKKINYKYNTSSEFILSFDCHYRYKTYIFWKKFIISIIKYLKKFYDISLLRRELKYETKMTFLLPNDKNIHYSDENNYILNQPLDISKLLNSSKFKIQFQPLVYIINDKCYLINKITGIYLL